MSIISETIKRQPGNSMFFPALLCAVGLAAWIILWFGFEPHASWDALFYHRIAAGYAGLTQPQQDAYAWTTFAPHANPEYRQWLIDHHSWPWGGWHDPIRERWVGLYEMRPLYPVLIAVGIPAFGSQAPMVVTALATIGFVLALGLGLARLVGRTRAIAVVGLCLATPAFSMWLVFLQTDGIAIALFAAALVLLALYLSEGRSRWIAGFGVAAGLLCFARPLAYVLPVAIAVPLAFAAIRRDRVVRRFGLALGVAVIPLTAFVAFSAWAGFPSFLDLLQDLPTVHFSQPDVQDPLGYLARSIAWQTHANLLPALGANPLLFASLLVAPLGYLWARPGWWATPFLVSIPFVAITYAIHPSISEVVRTLAPAWIGLHLGVVLFVDRARTVATSRVATQGAVGSLPTYTEAANPGAMSAVKSVGVGLAAAVFVVAVVYLAALLTDMSGRRTAVAFTAAIFALGAVYFGRKPFGSSVQVLGLLGTGLVAFSVGWGFWWLVSGPHI
jgi:hypothetical protein